MAKTDLPFNIDRRRLLTSAAAVTATGIAPGFEGADTAAAPDFFQSSPLTLEAEPPNFCAATAYQELAETVVSSRCCRVYYRVAIQSSANSGSSP